MLLNRLNTHPPRTDNILLPQPQLLIQQRREDRSRVGEGDLPVVLRVDQDDGGGGCGVEDREGCEGVELGAEDPGRGKERLGVGDCAERGEDGEGSEEGVGLEEGGEGGVRGEEG